MPYDTRETSDSSGHYKSWASDHGIELKFTSTTYLSFDSHPILGLEIFQAMQRIRFDLLLVRILFQEWKPQGKGKELQRKKKLWWRKSYMLIFLEQKLLIFDVRIQCWWNDNHIDYQNENLMLVETTKLLIFDARIQCRLNRQPH